MLNHNLSSYNIENRSQHFPFTCIALNIHILEYLPFNMLSNTNANLALDIPLNKKPSDDGVNGICWRRGGFADDDTKTTTSRGGLGICSFPPVLTLDMCAYTLCVIMCIVSTITSHLTSHTRAQRLPFSKSYSVG